MLTVYIERFADIPTGAIGVYTYFQRLAQGMRQLMTGCSISSGMILLLLRERLPKFQEFHM